MDRHLTHSRSYARCAFTLIELLVVIAIIALLIALLLPAIEGSRRTARKLVCSSNIRQFSIAYQSYANDYKDRIATFSWKPGEAMSDWIDLNTTSRPTNNAQWAERYREAAVHQATDIVRKATGVYVYPDANWFPHNFHVQLVLRDYMSRRFPEPVVFCPEDPARINAHRKLEAYSIEWLSASASSYMAIAAAFAQDQSTRGYGSFTVGPGPYHHRDVTPGNIPILGRKMTDIALPAAKVMMFDMFGRHQKRLSYHAYEDVVQPLLFCDGSVREKRSGLSPFGVDPNTDPANPKPFLVKYKSDIEGDIPPTRNGLAIEEIPSRYQWTKRGLKGFDYND